MPHNRRLLLLSVAPAMVACARQAPPYRADSGAIVTVCENGSCSLPPHIMLAEDINAESEWKSGALKVLHAIPAHLRVRIGDTIAPRVALQVSGVTVRGATIPHVAPLYGPFRGGGVVRRLPDGRWLAARVGRATVEVRVLRIVYAMSTDSALVRSVTVEVRP